MSRLRIASGGAGDTDRRGGENTITREASNAWLDNLVRTEIRVLGRRRPAFHVCGAMGLLLSVMVSLELAWVRHLEIGVVLGLTLVCCASFLALVMARKIMFGAERLVYYHHEIAALLAAAASLTFVGRPVLPYVDITVLGIGIFLACGRIGCLLVGCCHGRPALWGSRYRPEHVVAGFESCFAGVRLFPVPALEALCVLLIVVVGSALVATGRPPGEALAWCTITYAVARFGFEFLRGDPDRPYWRGSSEAQWTSLLLAGLAIWAELGGRLPFHVWHLLAAAFLFALTILNALRQTDCRRLVHPRHISEVAEALSRLRKSPVARSGIRIVVTSLGVRISSGALPTEEGQIEHYCFSRQRSGLGPREARTVAALFVRLLPDTGCGTIVCGNQGVFHLIIGRDQRLGSV